MPSPSVSSSSPSHLSHDNNFDTSNEYYDEKSVDLHAPGVALPPLSYSYSPRHHSDSSLHNGDNLSSATLPTGHSSASTTRSILTSELPPSPITTSPPSKDSESSFTVLNQAPFSLNTQPDVFHPDNPIFLEKYNSFKFQIDSKNPSTLFTDPIRTNFSKALFLNITWSSYPQKILSGEKPGKNGGGSGGGISLLSLLSSLFTSENLESTMTAQELSQTNALQVPLIYLFLKTESPIHQSSSGCRYGFLENGKCYLVHRLREVCIKVKVNDAGTSVQLDNSL